MARCSGRGGRNRSARRARPAFGGLVSRGEVASAAPLLGARTREPEREPLEEGARPLGVSESWICRRGFSVASALGPGGLSRLSPLLSELRLCPRILPHRGQGHIPGLTSELDFRVTVGMYPSLLGRCGPALSTAARTCAVTGRWPRCTGTCTGNPGHCKHPSCFTSGEAEARAVRGLVCRCAALDRGAQAVGWQAGCCDIRACALSGQPALPHARRVSLPFVTLPSLGICRPPRACAGQCDG